MQLNVNVTGCGKPSHCAAEQELLIQVEEREIADMILNCKIIKGKLSNDLKYKGLSTRRRGGLKDIQLHCSIKCHENKCVTCLAPENGVDMTVHLVVVITHIKICNG